MPPSSFPTHLAPFQSLEQRLMHPLDAVQHRLDGLDDLLGNGALVREERGPRRRQCGEALGGGVARWARPAEWELFGQERNVPALS